MEKSRLIQRLNKPYPTDGKKIINAFTFGGGYKNGGLSDEAMELLSDIFAFDYMGAAEFEFGAVPKTLFKIWENRKKYISKVVKVAYEYKDWRGEKQVYTGTRDIYIIALVENIKEIINRISHYAINEPFNGEYATKASILLNAAMATDERTAGWLELNNGYFFFIDKEMFNNVCKLLEIQNV